MTYYTVNYDDSLVSLVSLLSSTLVIVIITTRAISIVVLWLPDFEQSGLQSIPPQMIVIMAKKLFEMRTTSIIVEVIAAINFVVINIKSIMIGLGIVIAIISLRHCRSTRCPHLRVLSRWVVGRSLKGGWSVGVRVYSWNPAWEFVWGTIAAFQGCSCERVTNRFSFLDICGFLVASRFRRGHGMFFSLSRNQCWTKDISSGVRAQSDGLLRV